MEHELKAFRTMCLSPGSAGFPSKARMVVAAGYCDLPFFSTSHPLNGVCGGGTAVCWKPRGNIIHQRNQANSTHHLLLSKPVCRAEGVFWLGRGQEAMGLQGVG